MALIRVYFPLISAWRTLFNIYCRANLLVMNSFGFCLSGQVLISLSFLEDSFARYRILHGQGFFSPPCKTLAMSSHYLWPPWFIKRNHLLILLRITWTWWITSFLLLSKLFFFEFWQFNYLVSQCEFLWVYLLWSSLSCLDVYIYLFTQILVSFWPLFIHFFPSPFSLLQEHLQCIY